MNELEIWIHDDRTWCSDNACPIINCIRNPKNMIDHSHPHSFANFRECDECPIYRMERDADLEREELTK